MASDAAPAPPVWLTAYLGYLQAQRRASPATLLSYRRDLLRLAELCAGAPPQGLTPQDIRRFVARLHGAGLTGRSIARALSAWRGLFRWFIRQFGELIAITVAVCLVAAVAVLPALLSVASPWLVPRAKTRTTR